MLETYRGSPSDQLRAMYADIRQRCDGKADAWPHAAKMRSRCYRDARGKYQPPAFTDGNGPIGIYAMLDENDEAVGVCRRCREAFERGFLQHVRNALDAEQLASFDQLLFVPAESRYHICVAIFHEHPSLLDEQSRARWRPVAPTEAAALGATVQARTERMGAPRLTLDSLCVCDDGALIAGFLDDERGRAAALRAACAAEGEAALGELTSRPKSLFHVTVGRLLGAPEGLRREQADTVARAVRASER